MYEMLSGEAIIIGSALTKFDTPLWLFGIAAGLIAVGFWRVYKKVTA